MRISGLLVVLLCGLVSVCVARDPSRQSSSSQAAANPLSSERFNSSAIAQHDFFDLPGSDRTDRDQQRLNWSEDGDVVCYTIENFLVKRESPHSDVTEPYGYSTCLPASKYSVRMVEEPGKAPSR